MSGLTAAGMTAGSIAGAGSYILGAKSLTVGSNNVSTTVSGVISRRRRRADQDRNRHADAVRHQYLHRRDHRQRRHPGRRRLDRVSSLTTVNAGATLAGSGTVGNTAIAGGTLAPGSAGGSIFGPLTVQGSLSFTTASTYMIQVSPANAGLTNVTGTATLGGATVNAVFAPGSYVEQAVHHRQRHRRRQRHVQSGRHFQHGEPPVDAHLRCPRRIPEHQAEFVPPSGSLTINQQNVANALTNFFNSTGSIPAAFAGLNAAGLTIASGELGTGVIQSSIKADDLFLNLLLDPTIAGRAGGFARRAAPPRNSPTTTRASAYAARAPGNAGERDAYAMATKAPPWAAPPVNRWSVWGAAYGGSETVGGNTVVGSQDMRASA